MSSSVSFSRSNQRTPISNSRSAYSRTPGSAKAFGSSSPDFDDLPQKLFPTTPSSVNRLSLKKKLVNRWSSQIVALFAMVLFLLYVSWSLTRQPFLPPQSSPPGTSHVDDPNIHLVSISQPSSGLLEVEFENIVTHLKHLFVLQLDNSMFATEAKNTMHPVTTYQSVFPSVNEWGTAQLLSPVQIQGHFSSPALGGQFEVHAFDNAFLGHSVRRLQTQESIFSDVVEHAAIVPSKRKPVLLSAEENAQEVIKFFPGCFPNDLFPHTLKLSIAVDQGFMTRIEATTAEQVQRFVESFFGVVRVLYLTQLNVNLQIKELVLPTPGGTDMLAQSKDNGQCKSHVGFTMSAFAAFANTGGILNRDTAHWHLLTDCHPSPGAVGAAYIGGLCMPGMNVGITSWTRYGTWLTFAHELGHILGAEHTFELYGQGGIMDYGGGTYHNGIVQFNPSNKEEMCSTLTTGGPKCGTNNFFLASPQDQCGNGLLELNEECECLIRGQTQCGAGKAMCKNCKLASKSVECSIDTFVVRGVATAATVLVADAVQLSHAECCVNNAIVPAPKDCDGQRGVCNAQAQCKKACANYFLPGCGFESNGCVQRCVYQGSCQGAKLTSQGPPPIPVGAVPDGLPCTLVANEPSGMCSSGVCVKRASTNGPTTAMPMTSAPTSSREPTSRPTPSRSPTTLSPTSSKTPTSLPTSLPTSPCPQERNFYDCPRQKTQADCEFGNLQQELQQRGKRRRKPTKAPVSRTLTPTVVKPVGCHWCENKCMVSTLACERSSEWVSKLYAHCRPFLQT